MMRFFPKDRQKGMSLVEVVIAATIITIFVFALANAYSLYLNVVLSGSRNVKANFIAEETIEVVKFLRRASWNTNIASLTNGTNYYLAWQGGSWVSTTTNNYIDSTYERKFVLSAVNRDAQSNITSSGGTVDPNTRKVTATISWREGNATSTRIITAYITNLFNN